jgi:ribosomal protein S18 acetylase RimI-like enzyme
MKPGVNKSNLKVRKAQLPDAQAIAHFNQKMAWETELFRITDDLALAGVIHLLKSPRFGFYLVAEYKGYLAGSCMVTYEWSDWRDGIIWWIQSVYIEPASRRLGIFREMYRNIIELSKSKPQVKAVRLYVDKENTSARAAYLSLGMKESNYNIFEYTSNK